MSEEITTKLITTIIGILGTIITTILLPYVVNCLKAKTNNETLKYVIDELNQTVVTGVDYIQQTFVEQLKKDGKFDSEKQKEALDKAVNVIWNGLSDRTVNFLKDNSIEIEKIIVKYVESYIASKKS